MCLATCLSLNVYSKERFVIRQFAYFKPIWCTYLKYTHFTYWSLKLKRIVCITCRAISLTSKPETNLANPRLLIFFFCWYIPLRVVCLLNNSKNSRNFFYLKWIHVFFCSLLVIMNFSHHFQMAYQKGVFFAYIHAIKQFFKYSRSKRFVFIHIIFFLLSYAKSKPKLSFVSGGRSKKELVFISQNLGAVFILTGHKQ